MLKQPIEDRVVSQLRVLIVDDHNDCCGVLACALSVSGIEVAVAYSAQQALDCWGSFHPNLVLSDIAMPGEDGFSLLTRIRQLACEGVQTLPVIALSASQDGALRSQGLQLGLGQWLTKPIELDELLDAIAPVSGRLACAG